MDHSRSFEQLARDYAAAACEAKDGWYALRFCELAAHFAAMARQATGDRRAGDSTARG